MQVYVPRNDDDALTGRCQGSDQVTYDMIQWTCQGYSHAQKRTLMEKVLNDEAFPTATKRDLDRMWSRRYMMSRCGHPESELQDREHYAKPEHGQGGE